MTARQSSTVLLDAATVYAEGLQSGLRTAINLLARTGNGFVPKSLRMELVKAQSVAIHREWLAAQSRPVPFAQSEKIRALIDLACRTEWAGVLSDGQ